MPYIECESYAHRFAKQTLAEWFREKYKANKNHSYQQTTTSLIGYHKPVMVFT